MSSARTRQAADAPGLDPRSEPREAVGARAPSELSVLVSIVNYRTSELVVDCLASLVDEARALRMRVVVVDNASGDGSAERIRRAIDHNGWGTWTELRALATNGGFSAGNNAAIGPALAGAAPPDYALLLNPDTRARPGAVSALLEFMEAHPDVGIAGSRLEDEDGTQQHSRYRFPNALGELEANVRLRVASRLLARWRVAPPFVAHDHECDWVAGASMIVRRAVLDGVSAFDERYFLYYEEVDFCRRARMQGWRVWFVPASRVVHLVGKSSGVTGRSRVEVRRPCYWFSSRRRYFVTHHGRAYAFMADVCWLAGFAAWTVRRVLQRKPERDPPHLGRDFLRFTLFCRAGWTVPR